ncbi:MAG: protein-L-isoaspartate O-methyltransferase [Alphaproteobacteria bacterium]|nr:protein-L-isoaspartate O-methyltransferase [Alphaproteobacteria bacterium]MCY4320185.1 protein-L-isoaspartate O-methyltransferase [Alphaproteobacteria bacterium]
MSDYIVQRANMVECQLRAGRVMNEALLDAMGSVAREEFAPVAMRPIAYADDSHAFQGRVLVEPMIFGRLAQAAEPGVEDYVLDVGAGLGYSSAVLGRIASAVVALESDGDLAACTRRALAADGSDNVLVIEGPLEAGCPEEAPFNVIIVQGAVAAIPPVLLDQLAEGGRLAAILRPGGGPGRATIFTKRGGVISSRIVFDANAPYLAGFEPKQEFVF